MEKPKVGLLPLYLKLYDEVLPGLRKDAEFFLNKIQSEITNRGIDVINGKICTLKEEFDLEIKKFEDADACAIITLHLAYSPSLESINSLAGTNLPIIVFDTTPDYEFGPGNNPDRIMNNHGIHGVQDMCNLLLKNGKSFYIVAGHWSKSGVIEELSNKVKSAFLAWYFKQNRIGRIGGPFKGMGDFQVENRLLKNIYGIDVFEISPEEIASYIPGPGEAGVKEEIKKDREFFLPGDISEDCLINSIRIGIAIRRWIEKEGLSGFTINFSAIERSSGFITMPFLEASKSMSRGIGYAGEGDTITAALNAALLKIGPDSSFAEMFCPDWKNNMIFLSHMGEININAIADKPVLAEKKLPFLKLENPAIAFGRFKPGPAQIVNLAPVKDCSFNLIVSDINIEDAKKDNFKNTIRGWFKPENKMVAEFLKEFSMSGGTHHSVIIYGKNKDIILDFGRIMSWNTVEI